MLDPRRNQRDDLSYEEFERLSLELGSFENLNLSGGEPFIREDFADIVIELVRGVSPLVVNIPTNMLTGTHDIAVFDLNNDGWNDIVIGRCNTTEIWMSQPPEGLARYPNAQRPLATVVIGGLITSALLTLLVLPAIFAWFAGVLTASSTPFCQRVKRA